VFDKAVELFVAPRASASGHVVRTLTELAQCPVHIQVALTCAFIYDPLSQKLVEAGSPRLTMENLRVLLDKFVLVTEMLQRSRVVSLLKAASAECGGDPRALVKIVHAQVKEAGLGPALADVFRFACHRDFADVRPILRAIVADLMSPIASSAAQIAVADPVHLSVVSAIVAQAHKATAAEHALAWSHSTPLLRLSTERHG
jgi:hypothetical protein